MRGPLGAAAKSAGNGWRGPVNICPGRFADCPAVGTGRPSIPLGRAIGGAIGLNCGGAGTAGILGVSEAAGAAGSAGAEFSGALAAVGTEAGLAAIAGVAAREVGGATLGSGFATTVGGGIGIVGDTATVGLGAGAWPSNGGRNGRDNGCTLEGDGVTGGAASVFTTSASILETGAIGCAGAAGTIGGVAGG